MPACDGSFRCQRPVPWCACATTATRHPCTRPPLTDTPRALRLSSLPVQTRRRRTPRVTRHSRVRPPVATRPLHNHWRRTRRRMPSCSWESGRIASGVSSLSSMRQRRHAHAPTFSGFVKGSAPARVPLGPYMAVMASLAPRPAFISAIAARASIGSCQARYVAVGMCMCVGVGVGLGMWFRSHAHILHGEQRPGGDSIFSTLCFGPYIHRSCTVGGCPAATFPFLGHGSMTNSRRSAHRRAAADSYVWPTPDRTRTPRR